MAKDRTAIDTIRGYYYQFDLYALRIFLIPQHYSLTLFISA